MISVVMSSFNRPHLLFRGLQSIARQRLTDTLEVVVVNDGKEDDGTRDVCSRFKSLNIKYIFSGQRNRSKLIVRNPAVPNNLAVSSARGDVIILTCPEIYHLDVHNFEHATRALKGKSMVVPHALFMDSHGVFLGCIERALPREANRLLKPNITICEMPYFLVMHKKHFMRIGGYDEDFVGYACEDNDLVNRLLKYGLVRIRTAIRCVHLYHGNATENLSIERVPSHLQRKYIYNYHLLTSKPGIYRNGATP